LFSGEPLFISAVVIIFITSRANYFRLLCFFRNKSKRALLFVEKSRSTSAPSFALLVQQKSNCDALHLTLVTCLRRFSLFHWRNQMAEIMASLPCFTRLQQQQQQGAIAMKSMAN